jgi:hypothetical protein
MQSASITAIPHEDGRAFVCGGSRRAVFGIRAGLVIAFLFVLAGRTADRAQLPGSSAGSNPAPSPSRTGGFGRPSIQPNDDSDYDPMMAERRAQALNAERQKQMVADANKLLKLAKELNDEVAAANENAFTPDQLRKIAEIEKLAKNVRERMTAGSGQPSNQLSTPSLFYPVH